MQFVLFTRELRIACTLAQMEREGGISPRVSPLAQACIIAKVLSCELDDGILCYLTLSVGNAIMNSMILFESNSPSLLVVNFEANRFCLTYVHLHDNISRAIPLKDQSVNLACCNFSACTYCPDRIINLELRRPFVLPFQVRDAGNLLTRAGFTLPGVDVDEYTVKYESGENFHLV